MRDDPWLNHPELWVGGLSHGIVRPLVRNRVCQVVGQTFGRVVRNAQPSYSAHVAGWASASLNRLYRQCLG